MESNVKPAHMGQFQDLDYVLKPIFDSHCFIDHKISRKCLYFGYFSGTLLKKSQEC